MNILTLGSDRGLFLGHQHPTAQRFIAYSMRVGWIGAVVYAPKGACKKMELSPSCTIYPSDSLSRLTYVPDTLKLCSEIIRRKRIDVLVSQDPFIFGLTGYLLKKKFNIPLVVHFHADFLANRHWLKESPLNFALHKLGFFVSRRADLIRAVSTRIVKKLVSAGIEKQRLFYASPPVAAEAFTKRDRHAEEAIIERYALKGRKAFVFIGRLCKQKNVAMIVRAVEQIKREFPELKILLLGDGPEWKHLENMASRFYLNDVIVFVGKVPNEKLNSFIRVARAVILPSFYEGTAKVMKEAALAGRPTICTKTSGADDVVVHEKTGLIIPVGDVDALALAMRRFLKESGLSEKMGQAAFRFVRSHFNYEDTIDSIVAIWKLAPRIAEERGLK